MATWQLGGLPSMAPQNDNAPRSSVPQPVQYQQQPNVGLMALQGLRGVAEINQQARQQQRKAEFQKAYAGAFESGDRNKMRSLISEYPEEFESVQKGMGFIDDDQRNSIGHLATSAQIASSLGTGAFGKFIADNEDEMRRLGISPESVAEMHVNDPQGFQRLAGSMALFSLGHEKYFDIKDQMEGRDIERGKLAETIRSNQAGEALQARGQDISRANALTSAYAPTAAMQNYNQYAQMLKADPEGAAAFAAAAGINTNAKKLMSVRENDDGTVTKYYTDGSEEQGKLNQPISGDGFRPIALPTAQKIMEKSPEGAKKAAGFAYRVRDALDSIDTLKDQLSPQRVAIINNALGNGTLAGESVEQAKQAFYAAYPLPSTNEIDRSQSATQNIQHTSSDNSLASGYAKLATQQREGLERSAEQGASLGAAMRDAITGESRMTPEMERLQNVDLAPELTSLSMDALKARWSQLFGSDASQEKILQSMGAKLRQDEKGNTIVSLPSGDYALNKPGLSPQDVASFLANALAFTPAGRAGTVLGAIGKSAATDLALQGATSLAGGEDIDPLQTVISAGIGGIGKGLENTASAVSRAVRGDMSPEAKAAVDFASERNLPLMTSDMLKDKTFMQSQAQTLGERVPFFGTGKNRLNQQQARENLVRTFSDGLGGISDKQLYESATKGQQKFIEAAGKRYNRIIDAMGDTPVDLSNTVKAIDNQIAVLSRPGKSQDRAAVKVLQQFKDDITSGPNDLRLARENRTDLRKRFMASSDTVDKDTLQKASDIIYKAYTADMKKAVAKNLGADEAINMARVDRSWSKFNDMMGRTRVQKAIASGKATPEDVTKLVFSQSPSERSQLYRLLDDNGRQNARAAIVQNAVDKATDPSGNISVEKFINALHRNRKQSATFFKGVHGKELDGVIKYLNDTRHAAKANVQNLNGQQLYGLLVGGGIINAAVLAGMLKTAAFVVPAAGAVGGAAKAYESPVIRNALLRLANTPKGSTAYDRAISTVTQSLTRVAQASQKEAQ